MISRRGRLHAAARRTAGTLLVTATAVAAVGLLANCSGGGGGSSKKTIYVDGSRVVATVVASAEAAADRVIAAALSDGGPARNPRVTLEGKAVPTQQTSVAVVADATALIEQALGVDAADFAFVATRQTKREDVSIALGDVVTASFSTRGITGPVALGIMTAGQLESGLPVLDPAQFVLVGLDTLPVTARKAIKQVEQARTVEVVPDGDGFLATFDIEVTFENVSDEVLFQPFFLTKGPFDGTLLNADGGPGGAGTTLTPVGENGTSDGEIAPGERFKATFVFTRNGASGRVAASFPKTVQKAWLPLNFRLMQEDPTPSPAGSPTPAPSPSPSVTPSPAGTPQPNTPTPGPTAAPTPTATPAPTPTPTPAPTPTPTPTPTPSASAAAFTCTGLSVVPDPDDPTHGHLFDGGECNRPMAVLAFRIVSGSAYTSFTIPMPAGEITSTIQPNDTVRGTNADPKGNPKMKIEAARFTTAGPNPHSILVMVEDGDDATFGQTVVVAGD